jgi:hypothetical protein
LKRVKRSEVTLKQLSFSCGLCPANTSIVLITVPASHTHTLETACPKGHGISLRVQGGYITNLDYGLDA